MSLIVSNAQKQLNHIDAASQAAGGYNIASNVVKQRLYQGVQLRLRVHNKRTRLVACI